MENSQIELLTSFLKSKKKFITQYGMSKISDKEERIVHNIRKYSGVDLPEWVKNTRDVLDLIDRNLGMCERSGCQNKKKKEEIRWTLRKFCSRKCADLDFSEKQKGERNSFHNITQESRIEMGKKISSKISKRISNGTFTPNITNSWANSKISISINGSTKFVRSSWEAYFYLLNQDLMYEFIRIPYFDSNKKVFRNYITDFCDPVNKIIYEIKPKSKIKESPDKIRSAKKWCRDNLYEYKIITQDWIIERYSREVLKNQPEGDRIALLIEKMIKYEN